MEKKVLLMFIILLLIVAASFYFIGQRASQNKETNITKINETSTENESNVQQPEEDFQGPKTVTVNGITYSTQCSEDFDCMPITVMYGDVEGAVCVNSAESGVPNDLIKCACDSETNTCEPEINF